MTSTRFVLAATLALAGFLPAAAGAASYLCFGDSITYGNGGGNRAAYLGFLGDYLSTAQAAPAEMIQQGLPGETTNAGVARLNAILNTRRTDYVLIMEGTNDTFAWFREVGHSPAQTQSNLRAMVRAVRGAGSIPILATVAPRLPNDNSDPDNSLTRQLNDRIRAVASAEGVALAEVFDNVYARLDRVLYSDTIHPDDLGHQLVAEAFAAAILNQPVSGIDLTAPLPLTLTPRPNSSGNSLDLTIRVGVAEDKHPIDPALAVISIDGQPVTTVVDTTSVPGQTIFVYDFPSLLAFNQTVRVGVNIADTSVPPNVLSFDYTLRTTTGNGTAGDIDRSGRIDGFDLALLAASFGVDFRDPRYRGQADIDANGVVDGFDLMLLTSRFGGPP